jgi:prepilin-type N-terminal cleavage/methylation domain-containing protein
MLSLLQGIRNGASRPAFTLIECTAALAVFAFVMLLWRPVLQGAQGLRTHDEALVQALVANRGLEEKAAGGYVRAKEFSKDVMVHGQKQKQTEQRLVIAKAGVTTYEVGFFHSDVNGDMVRVTTGSGGYMPLFMKAKKFAVATIAEGTVRYTVTLADGQEFSGVLSSDVKPAAAK